MRAFATSALMLSMPRLFSLSCDMVERKVFLMNFEVLKPRSPVATVGGMAKKIRAATEMLGKCFSSSNQLFRASVSVEWHVWDRN